MSKTLISATILIDGYSKIYIHKYLIWIKSHIESMCGIFAYLDYGKNTEYDVIDQSFQKLSHRGPDSHKLNIVYESTHLRMYFGFHRLAIMGLNSKSDQPIKHPKIEGLTLICNGEIYNYEYLKHKYALDFCTDSDCEVILHLYNLFGLAKTLELIDGEFAFTILDVRNPINPMIVAGRDQTGVRPLFTAFDSNNKLIGLSSELKGLYLFQNSNRIAQFPVGTHMTYSLLIDTHNPMDGKCISKKLNFVQYYHCGDLSINPSLDPISDTRKLLIEAVVKRLMSDRQIGVLLSGGLDSSLIASIASKYSKYRLKSFSIGSETSSDVINARKVAKFLGTDHYEIPFDFQKGIKAIPSVIKQIESYDVTTIRASTPMYLLSEWISKNTDVRVLLTGEGSDEIFGGYLYFHGAPSEEEFQKETVKLVSELHAFDVLRCDRAISAWGLEARVPFLDKNFLPHVISLPPRLKNPKDNNCIEKYILRKSFDPTSMGESSENFLPTDVLWRSKEAFSDGVGYGWKDSLIEYSNKLIPDDLFDQRECLYPINTPLTKEGLLYRCIFDSFYFNNDNVIPHYWMPNWVNSSVNDPSATVLSVHPSNSKFNSDEKEKSVDVPTTEGPT